MGDLLLRVGATPFQAREALAILQRVANEDAAASRDNAIIGLWTECARSLLERLQPAARELCEPSTARVHYSGSMSQAAAVAQALAEEIRGTQGLPGERLGSELQLCERYAVSVVVMRQAIRILEEGGWVQTQRGRGCGLRIGEPVPAAIAPRVRGYLIAHRISAQTSREAHITLNVVVARERNPILVFFLDSLPTGAGRGRARPATACNTTDWARDTPALES
jgi:DNA-binding transcriptional regulator YhcF (GntR family)